MTVKQFAKSVLLIYHGAQNRGKTTVLNLLVRALEHESSLLFYRKQGSIHGRDRQAVALLDDFWVGVGTSGDSQAAVLKNCEYFEMEKCSICVTASHDDSKKLLGNPALVAKLSRYKLIDVPAGSAGCDTQNMATLFYEIKKAIAAYGATASVRRHSKRNPWTIAAW